MLKKHLVALIIILLPLMLASGSSAQTLLEAGDIAFTGYITVDDNNVTQDDQISFVILKDIDAGTTILFTDLGWTNAGRFQDVDPCGAGTGSYNDGVISWTTASVLSCGTQVTINCRRGLTAGTGTVAGITPTFNNPNAYLSLGISDQVFAFQGSTVNPSLIAAMSINRAWDLLVDSCDFTSLRSMLPAGLGAGVIAVFPAANNAIYNCAVTSGDTLTLLTALTDVANWNKDTTTLPPVPASFQLPPACSISGCALTPPSISQQPVNVSDCEDDTVSFSINSLDATAWQWQRNIGGVWTNVIDTIPFSGSNTETLTLSGIPFALNGAQFRCIALGAAPPQAISNAATVTVIRKPTLIGQTPDRAICEGNSATFNATVAGAGLVYQWQFNNGSGWTNLSNTAPYSAVTAPTLVITAAPATLSGTQYRCQVSGSCPPSITSNPVTLTVNQLPLVLTEPVNDTICASDTARFSITATGSGLGFRWQVNTGSGFVNVSNGGGLYFGASTPNLTILNAPTILNAARYRCFVTGFCAPTDTSAEATLFIAQPPATPAISTGNATQCQGNTGVLFGIIPVDSLSTYTWSYTGSDAVLQNTNGTSVTVDFGANAGNGTLAVSASNQCGNSPASSLNITLNQSFTSHDTVRVCPGDSVLIYGLLQNLEGDYTDAYTTVAGCDSIFITTLKWWPVYNRNQQVFICSDDSFFVAGSWQTTAGIYTDSLTSLVGCDSVINTELLIAPVYTENASATICSGDSIFLAGAWQTQAGIYTDVFTNLNGCDSTVITTLAVNQPAVSLTLDTVICLTQGPLALFGGSPTGGTWSGTGVSGNQFDPQVTGAGSFILTYSYTDSSGCSNTASDTLIVDVCAGISETNPAGLLLYPNPAGEVINVWSAKGLTGQALIRIYNHHGQVVETIRTGTQPLQKQLEIPVRHLAAGSYLLVVESREGQSRLPLLIAR